MEREEKVRGREREKQDLLRVKLKSGILVGKRGGNSTPSPTWKFGMVQTQTDACLLGQDFNFPSNTTTTTTLSARKLGANLWEIQPQSHQKVIKMSQTEFKPHIFREKSADLLSKLAEPPPDGSSKLPTNEDGLGKRFTESLKQHNHLNARNDHTLQLSSLASYSSSMEMAPCHPSLSPTSSLKIKRRIGSSSYSLKTSTELLKVLNRIWSLEEQHVSNMSLMKDLKRDLEHSRTQVKELLQEKQRYQQEIDYLKKKMIQIKVSGRVNGSDQITDVIRSLRNELEDERKLRKHSESLHRKLARELSESKFSSSDALKELKRERRARILLEELCDEFAKGIKDYEQEVRLLRQKKKNDPFAREHSHRLILHLSEAWMDGRMQMKQEEHRTDLEGGKLVAEKLSSEIETFLRAKRNGISRNNDHSRSNLYRHSPASCLVDEAVNAGRRNRTHSDSVFYNVDHDNGWCKQLKEHDPKSHVKQEVVSNALKKVQAVEVPKEVDFSNLQMQSNGCISADIGVRESKTEHMNSERAKMRLKNPDTDELKQEGLQETKDDIDKSGNLLRTKSLPAEVKKNQHENIRVEDTFDPSQFTGPASPVEKWTSVAAPNPEISEASIKQPQTTKGNTLRDKLLEARLERRPRTSKGFPQADD